MHLSTYGLALFFIVLPFEYPLAALGTQSVLMLVGVATMGMAVVDLIATQKFQIQFNYRIVIPVLWLIYAGASMGASQKRTKRAAFTDALISSVPANAAG